MHCLGVGVLFHDPYNLLGGGISNIFFFHPDPWGNGVQFDLRIFFRWVGSTTNYQLMVNSWLGDSVV